ncbi:MAG: hypothetical protein HOV68_00125 [Streptomycetaceae bacterium]|nr:hypothetical protein [Streptomycetaceae bacterium]
MLGRLEAVRDGLPVYVRSGHKPRLVLAVLLARADRVVTTEGLIAAVWGDRPPASARRNVQQYVLQLRDALGGGLLARQDNGYVATVGDHLDAARFRRLAAEGEAALASGEVERASRTLRTALDLWRGAAFAEFVDCPAVAPEAAGLEQCGWTSGSGGPTPSWRPGGPTRWRPNWPGQCGRTPSGKGCARGGCGRCSSAGGRSRRWPRSAASGCRCARNSASNPARS